MIAIDLFRGLCLQASIGLLFVEYSTTDDGTSLSEVSYAPDFRTRLFTTGLFRQQNIINAHTHTLIDLVCRSRFFVDTSLLIRFLADKERVLITLPRAFGKSINLMMIYTFYNMEIREGTLIPVPRNETKAFQLFESGTVFCDPKQYTLQDKFLVSDYKDEVFYSRMASIPVIYINFGNPPDFQNYKEVCAYVRGVLHRSVLKHNYILHAEETSKRVQTFQRDFQTIKDDKDETTSALINVIPNLIQLLYEIFNVNVLILVDEYDSIMNNIHFGSTYLSEIDRKTTMSFLSAFFGEIAKQSIHVDRIFLTGILCWRGAHFFTSMSRMDHHTVSGGAATKFYGMEENIVRELLEINGLSHTFEQVRYYYNGYNFDSFTGQNSDKKYNPYAIARFVYANGISQDMNEWTKTSSISKLLGQLLKYKTFHENILSLISYEFSFSIQITRGQDIATFSMDQLDTLISAIKQASAAPESSWYTLETSNDCVTIALDILLAAGYLTISDQGVTRVSNTDFFPVRITNQEIRNALTLEYFMCINKGQYPPQLHSTINWRTSQNELANKLSNVLQSRAPDFVGFAEAFEVMLDRYISITYFIKGNEQQKAYANEALFESLFMSIIHYNIFTIGVKRVETQHDLGLYGIRPDVVCQTPNNILTIFEMKYLRGDCNREDIIEMLNSGGRQSIGYAKWYLTGPYHHLYKASFVRIVVLLVKQSDYGVVLRTYILENDDREKWKWDSTTHWPKPKPGNRNG